MNRRLAISLAVMFGWALFPADGCPAQSRSEIGIRTPGAISTVGGNSVGYRFTNQSYGLGSLQSSSAGGGNTNILRSSIAGMSDNTISRGSSVGGTAIGGGGGLNSLMSAPAAAFSSKGNAYLRIGAAGASGIAPDSPKGQTDANDRYMKLLQLNAGDEYAAQKAVTSLVPDEPGMYRNCMERGENALKNADYARAYAEFNMANTMAAQRDWASLLDMCHARFAVSTDIYATSAMLLCRSLEYFPELPSIALQPMDFFGDRNKHVERIIRLEQHVRDNPDDPEGAFVLAYFRWFEPDPKAAQAALSVALAAAQDRKNTELTAGIQTFWRGMVSTGKVSGNLEPATRPAKEATDSTANQTSQPASATGG